MAYDYSQRQNLKTGLFVLIGLTVTIASIIVLGGSKSLFTSYQTLKVKFKQVQGLNVGSVVSLSGINIGNIKNIEFSNEDVIVSLNIEEKFSPRINSSSVASIKTQGALGDRYIYIDASPQGAPLREGEFLKSGDSGDFIDMLSEKGPELTNITQIVVELKTLLANINKDNNSAKVVANLTAASEKANHLFGKGEQLVDDLRGGEQRELAQAIKRLNNILAKVDRGEGTIGALINDPSVHERITAILGKAPRNSYLKPLIRATIKTKDHTK